MRLRFSFGALFVGFLFITLLAGVLVPQALIHAQTATDDRRAQLQSQLNALEKEIADNQAVVDLSLIHI